MKSWTYGINSLYKTASIYLETAPWYIFAIRALSDFLCDSVPPITLPNFKLRLKNEDAMDCNEGQEWTTLKEWYGDLQQLFHVYIHMPIFYFCTKRIEPIDINIDYDELRELFYESDKEFWDENEKE